MKKYVSWEMIEEFVHDVANNYANENVTGVYGLPRGGLVLAVMISHKMNIPMLMAPVDNCIIVDDICDSGESLLHYVRNTSANQINPYIIVTLYHKDNALGIIPHFSPYEKGEDWIVFPWEDKEE